MNRILGIAIAISVTLTGCLQTTAADGTIKCAAPGGEQCPTGYYCATDNTCWHNGHTATTSQGTCTDGIKNGKETGTDCGGGTCPACAVGDPCNVAADCVTDLCKSSTCATPPAQCQNGVQDPGETAIDCGGPTCAACANGKMCSVNSDCVSMVCDPTSHLCIDQCADGKRDGDETDIDCGGSCSNKCVAAQSCGLPADCATGTCTGGFCIAASGPPNWIKVADYPTNFVQYWPQTAVGPDGVIYMLGGCEGAFSAYPGGCGDGSLASSYDPLTNTFNTNVTFLPHARAAGGAALGADGKIYLLEGFAYSSASQPEVAVLSIDAFDPVSGNWTPNVGTTTVAGTYGPLHPAVVAGASGEIYAFGGQEPALNNPASSVVQGFTPSTGMVDTTTIPLMPVGMVGAGAARGQDGNLYVLLGYCEYCTGPFGVQIYNETSKNWATYVAPIQLPTSRSGVGSAIAGDGRIYVVGGSLGQVSTAASTTIVEAYTPKTNNWATVASMTTDRAYPSTALGPDGRIYAIGGISISGTTETFRSTVEAYGPVFTLVSNKGAAGTVQGLTGSNFAASATVNVYFDTGTTPVATTTTDASGGISGTITYHVPSVAAGVYRLTAIDNKSAYPVYASFTVQ